MKLKKVLMVFLTIVLSAVIVYAADVFVQVAISEKYNISTGNYKLTINDSNNYYDLISLPTISSSSSINYSIDLYNTGDVKVYYDIVLKTNVNGMEIEYEDNSMVMIQNKTVLFYESESELKPNIENKVTIDLNIINSTNNEIADANLSVYVLYRESSKDEQSTNCYINKEFDIRKHLNSFSLNDKSSTKTRIPHFILLNDLEIVDELVINLPSTIDLLDNTLVLSAPVNIKHHYYGVYYINALSGGGIDNDNEILKISAPNCFYNFSDMNLISNSSNFIDVFSNASEDKIIFAAEAAQIYLKSLFLYDFVENNTTKYAIMDDIVLPKTFFNYPITYNYSSSNIDYLQANGHITRGSTDRDVVLTVSLKYNDTPVSAFENASMDYNLVIVGNTDDCIFNQTIREINRIIYSIMDRGSFPAGIMLPAVSMFDEDMTLNYELSSNKLVVYDSNTNIMNLIRSAIIDTNIDIKVTYSKKDTTNTATKVLTITIEGCTQAEKEKQLNSAFGPVYFVEKDFYDLFTTDLKLLFGIASVEYDIVAYNLNEDTDEFIADQTLSEQFYNRLIFDFTDPTADRVKVSSFLNFQITEKQKLDLKVTVKWNNNTVTEHLYNITIPAKGGSGGDDELVNMQQILQSVFTNNAYTITGFEFERKLNEIEVELEFADDSKGLSFCSIIQTENMVQIIINKNFIPTTNTIISITANIIVPNQAKVVQEYYFTIPGIYRLGDGEPYKDTNLYNAIKSKILQYKAGIYSETIWGRLQNNNELFNYVFRDSVILIDNFDISDLSIKNLSGMQYLTSLSILNLNNNPLTGTNKLANLSGLKIVKMYASNCGLIDSDLIVFQQLIELEEIDLSYNGITSLLNGSNSYFYRKIKKISLNNQTNLSDISGIEKMPILVEVNIENNKIAIFSPLLGLSNLKYAYVGNNIVAANTVEGLYDSSKDDVTIADAYGTNGALNKATYIELLERKVIVYNTNNALIVVGNSELAVHRAVNAILCYDKIIPADGIINLGNFDINMNQKDVSPKYTIEILLTTDDFVYSQNTTGNVQSFAITASAVGNAFAVYLKVTSLSDNTIAYRQIMIEKGS